MNYINRVEQILKKFIQILKSEKLFYAVTMIICLCNAVFMFDNAIWGDEGFSIVLVRKGIGEILSGTAADVHPPLYYLILKIVVSILGESVFVLHLTSYLAFVGVCILISTCVRKNFGLLSAYLAIFLTGWTEYGLIYNVEIRMYSMALLFITLTFCMAYKVIGDGKMKSWIFMSVFALLSGYTHYFALLAVAFIVFGVFIICLIKKQTNVWKKIGITTVICVVGYLPWLVAMITTVERTMDNFWLQAVPTFRECADMFFGAMDYSHKLFLVLLLLLAAYVLVNIWDVIREKGSVKEKFSCMLKQDSEIQMSVLGIFTFLGTAIVGIIVSNYIRPVLLIRYLFPMVVLGAVSLGALLHYFMDRKKIRYVVLLIATVMILFVTKSGLEAYQERFQVFKDRGQKTDISLAELDNYVEQGYMVLSNIDHFNWTVLEYYYPDNFRNYNNIKADEIDKAVILLEQELSKDQMQNLENGKYTIAYQNQGQIDNTEYYLYCFERE